MLYLNMLMAVLRMYRKKTASTFPRNAHPQFSAHRRITKVYFPFLLFFSSTKFSSSRIFYTIYHLDKETTNFLAACAQSRSFRIPLSDKWSSRLSHTRRIPENSLSTPSDSKGYRCAKKSDGLHLSFFARDISARAEAIQGRSSRPLAAAAIRSTSGARISCV